MDASAADLAARFEEFIARHGLLEPGEGVLVALSGGGDSMALLHLLAASPRAPRIVVAHLDHGLRERSAADRAFCEEAAGALSLPFRPERVDVAASRRPGESIETAARRLRYAFLGRVAAEEGIARVATGHTADDNVETVLLRLLRGTGTRGLAGIRPSRPLSPEGDATLVRPTLSLGRAELRTYLEARGIRWVEDETNDAIDADRNYLRHRVLPAIVDRWPSASEAILRAATLAGIEAAHLERAGEELLARAREDRSDGPWIAASVMRSSAPALALAAWRAALAETGRDPGGVSLAALMALQELASSDQGSAGIDLPGGLRGEREYGSIRMIEPVAAPSLSREPVVLNVPGETRIVPPGLLLRCEEVGTEGPQIGSSDEEVIDLDAAGLPLVVRAPMPGERMRPLGAPGTRKISDILIDARVPRRLRAATPLVSGREGPVWLVGVRLAHGVRITPATRRRLRMIVERPGLIRGSARGS